MQETSSVQGLPLLIQEISASGKEKVHRFEAGPILIGRADEHSAPDLDLTPDEAVSRRHARLFRAEDCWWIEDLGSRHGTYISGQRLEQPRPLTQPTRVNLGHTLLRILPNPQPESESGVEAELTIHDQLDSANASLLSDVSIDTSYKHKLDLLLDLPVQFAGVMDLDSLLQLVINRTTELTEGRCRGFVLLYDPEFETLQLKAYVAEGSPPVSRTLARKCLEEGRGYIWHQPLRETTSESILDNCIISGMYAPMLWQGRPVGVIGIDDPARSSPFSREQLRMVIAVAHYAAMAVVNHRQYKEILFNSGVLERLLTNFSPKVRNHLLARAKEGDLEPGGQQSEVTVLFLDMRNFSNTCKGHPPEVIMSMLQHYFSMLVPIVFQYDGTVDKFIGDSILAVFGSPEPDPEHHEKALCAAWALMKAAAQIENQRELDGKPSCGIGIGIECGIVLHGFIGGRDRLEFTVFGEPVNRAARYCAAAPGGEILISPELFSVLFNVVSGEETTIPTKHEGNWKAFRVTSCSSRLLAG